MYKDMWDVVGDEVVGASDIGWLARVPDPNGTYLSSKHIKL